MILDTIWEQNNCPLPKYTVGIGTEMYGYYGNTHYYGKTHVTMATHCYYGNACYYGNITMVTMVTMSYVLWDEAM